MPKASKKPILSVAEKLSRWKADFPVEDAEVAVQNSPLGDKHVSAVASDGGGKQNPRGPGQKGPIRIRTMKVCCMDNDSCVMSVDKVITYRSYTKY